MMTKFFRLLALLTIGLICLPGANAADAVRLSKEYQEKALAIQTSLTANDYETAATVAGDFSKQCRGACHDKYKPL